MKIDLDTAQETRLREFIRVLGIPDKPEAAAARAANRAATLAVDLFLEWALNERRFERIGQMNEHWIALIEQAFFPDSEPDPNKLYERYALSLPKAQYVARLLIARRTAVWRARARKELRSRLEDIRADAEAAVKAKSLSQPFDVILSRGAFDEFASAYSRAFEWPKTPLSQPHRRSSFGNQIVVELIAQVVVEVIKVLNAQS
jgi:hypothetical protein